MTLPSNDQVRQWIQYACDHNDVPGLSQYISVEWKRNYTFKMGSARYRSKTIGLSVPLFQRAAESDQQQTVIHEACHIIAAYKAGVHIKPHGREWKMAMRRCGLEPARCHSIKPVGIAPAVFTCGCRDHHVTKNKYTRIMKHMNIAGCEYRCTTCKQPLRVK